MIEMLIAIAICVAPTVVAVATGSEVEGPDVCS
jgi:hypothetical protein